MEKTLAIIFALYCTLVVPASFAYQETREPSFEELSSLRSDLVMAETVGRSAISGVLSLWKRSQQRPLTRAELESLRRSEALFKGYCEQMRELLPRLVDLGMSRHDLQHLETQFKKLQKEFHRLAAEARKGGAK